MKPLPRVLQRRRLLRSTPPPTERKRAEAGRVHPRTLTWLKPLARDLLALLLHPFIKPRPPAEEPLHLLVGIVGAICRPSEPHPRRQRPSDRRISPQLAGKHGQAKPGMSPEDHVGIGIAPERR